MVLTATFEVRGTVSKRLLVQARPELLEPGIGMYTHYGSVATPASMTITTR